MKMRNLWPLLMAGSVGAMAMQASANESYQLLVGSYTAGQSQGVYRLQFDSRTGQLDAKPLQVIKTDNPSWLTLSADMSRLFVVNENGPGQKDPVGKVSSYAIDPTTHALSLINQVQTLGNEPTHSSLSGDGQHLLVSNYSVVEDPGGTLAVLPVGADGKLAPVVQLSSHQPSRVNPERQMSAHVHSAVSSPDGKYVFANDLGADKVFVYRYDPKANPELPLTAADPAFVQLPPGSGPRHLLFSADGKHAWLTLEMTAQVAVFDYQDGRLVQRQLVDLAAGKPQPARAAAALHASKDGRFLYVSNRGTSNEVLVFAIDPVAGTLKELQRHSVEGDHPREFSLDPSGKFLLVANQKSNQIVVFARDPKTGLLGKSVQKLPMDAPSDMKFIQPR
ncbi:MULTISPECIES: lactonase family protein [unclassified Pseudomonas]|uniref:lactonase family protein n=1 Tax=unclassified Pseudomonas TaxID=196821 RepID=UPI0011A38150|nr:MULTISPECIES: lactonase family protein [unclassified Pseudomonas]TWC10596.1 6-phosphogluconolactonase (cycloisomerase 2 family) [Pseudomonas sp. SJZ075]TWC26751.1 6-phosphogluconolactonase (cycloisomerase 2 family) [Pseudomonas sp. SJZ078]TWC46149.1 6-phosphogluconolactonase (cycloisomerase 2 family) [Pseudomonas sp. SJZ124]TWC81220.1 6-phosphogluconolactonase (cycloisomerase 2 family) [Pseudomonas sp. SJZ101]